MTKSAKLPIIELFVSIQGEGPFSGRPCIFIRTTGCNLRCSFSGSICDTPYASWIAEAGKYTIEDVEEFIDTNNHINNLVITGGEPTIRPDLVRQLLIMAKKHKMFTMLETNGTEFIPELAGLLDFVVISPKLANSVPKPDSHIISGKIDRFTMPADIEHQQSRRINIDSMFSWMLHHKCNFKFVISDGSEMPEIYKLQALVGFAFHHTTLMPEGGTDKELATRRKMVWNLCLEHGYNYSDRLHILIFNKKRGV